MSSSQEMVEACQFLPVDQLNQLIAVLRADGYVVVGPTIDQNAIVYAEIRSVADLPIGWTDIQGPGSYRLKRRDDEACFGYVVGPHSWKQFLFPPVTVVASADRTETGWQMSTPDAEPPRYAFLGVRACELAAMKIQDRVFLEGPFVDPVYERRRTAALVIAVNCTQAAPTCFCTSMNTGPRCGSGYDLAMTELADGFVIEIGSAAGEALIQQLSTTPASSEQLQHAQREQQRAVDQISKQMDTTDIRNLLLGNLQHPHWQDVGQRCLSCTNCTMVCPTCFCSSVTEVPDLTGEHIDRERSWDSCFNIDFSYVNGVPTRNSISSRYRQWMTHKLASWQDQFGTSGCVGCGRCITWCPVGIDLTQEVAAIRATTEPSAETEINRLAEAPISPDRQESAE